VARSRDECHPSGKRSRAVGHGASIRGPTPMRSGSPAGLPRDAWCGSPYHPRA
jgi:hypothetical protein